MTLTPVLGLGLDLCSLRGRLNWGRGREARKNEGDWGQGTPATGTLCVRSFPIPGGVSGGGALTFTLTFN